MTKTKGISPKQLLMAAALLVVALLAFTARAAAADIPDKVVTVPAGETRFSVDVVITELAPYAGIELGLTLSSDSALEYVSFTKGMAVDSAWSSPFITKNGTHYFGFCKITNDFSGNLTVGTMNFKFTGDATQTITITYLMVARMDTNGVPVGTQSTVPVCTITVNRGASNPVDPPTNRDPPVLVIIEDESTPLSDGTMHSKYFDDIGPYPWAVAEIDSLYEREIVKGTGARIFDPATNVTRGDFMLVLVRAFDLKAEIRGNFPDVPQGSHYYDAIAIAKELGIAKGDGVSFYPQAPITRQDMMVLIDRVLTTIGKPLPTGNGPALTTFPDNAAIAEYARESVAKLVSTEIIFGDGYGIRPLRNTTRAEMAVVIYRLLGLSM